MAKDRLVQSSKATMIFFIWIRVRAESSAH
jgi:hypothetical protein